MMHFKILCFRFNSSLFMICLIIFSLSFLFISCSPTETEKQKLEVSIEDVSCTEAWLQVKGEPGSEIILKRNDNEVNRFTLTSSPQTIYDDSLQPNKTYSFQVSSIRNQESSNKINLTTLDTTSHNFNWQTFTFGGDAGSCTLFDAAIIDENNIWAVGEIYIADTSANGYTFYNAVHWDGRRWELKQFLFSVRILYPNSSGDTIGFSPIKSIYAFNENDIWVAAGTVQHWDGIKWQQFRGEYAGFSNKIWGSNSSDMYFIAGNGTIIHFQNGQWKKIESGTNLTIQDIWGDKNINTNQYEILCTASEKYNDNGKKVLKITGDNVEEVPTSGLPWSLSSIWFLSGRKYFVCGDGMYTNKNINETWQKDYTFPAIYKDRIRGTKHNDIIVSGSNGLVSHYNGYSWHHYINNELPELEGRYYVTDIKDNTVVCVGFINQQAVITLGKR